MFCSWCCWLKQACKTEHVRSHEEAETMEMNVNQEWIPASVCSCIQPDCTAEYGDRISRRFCIKLFYKSRMVLATYHFASVVYPLEICRCTIFINTIFPVIKLLFLQVFSTYSCSSKDSPTAFFTRSNGIFLLLWPGSHTVLHIGCRCVLDPVM